MIRKTGTIPSTTQQPSTPLPETGKPNVWMNSEVKYLNPVSQQKFLKSVKKRGGHSQILGSLLEKKTKGISYRSITAKTLGEAQAKNPATYIESMLDMAKTEEECLHVLQESHHLQTHEPTLKKKTQLAFQKYAEAALKSPGSADWLQKLNHVARTFVDYDIGTNMSKDEKLNDTLLSMSGNIIAYAAQMESTPSADQKQNIIELQQTLAAIGRRLNQKSQLFLAVNSLYKTVQRVRLFMDKNS